MMIKKQTGFTLVELMVTMVIFVLVIAAASSMFTGILNQFKQQSKIAETNIEGLAGLQMFRTDIEQAGYGLPYDLDGLTYTESTAAPASAYNDSAFTPPVPRAFVASDDDGVNDSDVLVIKATSVATNAAAHKWAYISNIGASNIMWSWQGVTGADIADENLVNGDRVIVLRPVIGSNQQVLVNNGGTFFTQFYPLTGGTTFSTNFQPLANSFETYIIYGINVNTDPIRPFNRADYYISSSNVPSRCALNTGVLIKSVINHDADGTRGGGLPLLDCVADMQVAVSLDMNEDGTPGTVSSPQGVLLTSTEGATATTVQETLDDASLLRKRLKNVRVYVLAHEGQKDTFYTYPNATINLKDQELGVLKAFDLSTGIGSTYVNYRWKVYTMVIKPFNLR